MDIADSVIDLIGNTPMVRLVKVTDGVQETDGKGSSRSSKGSSRDSIDETADDRKSSTTRNGSGPVHGGSAGNTGRPLMDTVMYSMAILTVVVALWVAVSYISG